MVTRNSICEEYGVNCGTLGELQFKWHGVQKVVGQTLVILSILSVILKKGHVLCETYGVNRGSLCIYM